MLMVILWRERVGTITRDLRFAFSANVDARNRHDVSRRVDWCPVVTGSGNFNYIFVVNVPSHRLIHILCVESRS